MAQIAHYFDTTGGASGALLFNNAEGFPKAIGIHWGDYGSQDPNRNWAVRLNSSVVGFIQTYSAL
jgi:V8-like Glu-specific endopeptidase